MLEILGGRKENREFVTKGSIDASAPNTPGTAVHVKRSWNTHSGLHVTVVLSFTLNLHNH